MCPLEYLTDRGTSGQGEVRGQGKEPVCTKARGRSMAWRVTEGQGAGSERVGTWGGRDLAGRGCCRRSTERTRPGQSCGARGSSDQE